MIVIVELYNHKLFCVPQCLLEGQLVAMVREPIILCCHRIESRIEETHFCVCEH